MKKQWRLFFMIAVLLVFFPATLSAVQEDVPAPRDETLRRGETRETLDPNLFKDARVRTAYQAAKDIPWILDSIYCYCFCEESFRHKSLLSCYVDKHAAM